MISINTFINKIKSNCITRKDVDVSPELWSRMLFDEFWQTRSGTDRKQADI